MNDSTVLPTPGEVLRTLITASGYRPYFVSRGLDKDLDDQAMEKRPDSNFELLHSNQAEWLCAIREDCGTDWCYLVDSAWQRHCDILRSLARATDTTGFILERAKDLLFKLLVIPELSGFIRHTSLEIPPLNVQLWWELPFTAWLQLATKQTNLPESKLLERLANHLDVDLRTLERWSLGSPIGKGLWPYRATTRALFTDSSLTVRQFEQLTGWLVMVVSLQSLPAELRNSVKHDFHRYNERTLKSERQVREQLQREAFDRSSLPLHHQAAPILDTLEQLFADTRSNAQRIRELLKQLHELCVRASHAHRVAHEFRWLWWSARLAANLGEQASALELYATACKQAWWRAGPNQREILHEALCYAVGVGDKVQAKHYWDKVHLLGLNSPPKQALDEQAMRLLSFEFERLFAPQKSKYRIPPPEQFVQLDKPFSLSAKDLAEPNRKRAHVKGRVRRTPLMDAVLYGTLEDVQQVVQAGGDLNVFIPESGENALIMALRRANERKDPDILQYLLTQDISPATANRPASTNRETPLKIALKMADVDVVNRLIELRADIEQPCLTSPSALIYSMALLYDSIHTGDTAQLNAYFEGRIPADAFDAKRGAIFDCELSVLRQMRMSMRTDPRKKRIAQEVAEYFFRPALARREVVIALLENGADPNRRYPDFNGHADRWTPTLFAAQLGDLEVLQAMIGRGGDPWIKLEESSALNYKDALWVAIASQRRDVVEYLLTLPPASIR